MYYVLMMVMMMMMIIQSHLDWLQKILDNFSQVNLRSES